LTVTVRSRTRSELPLRGWRILVTRARRQAGAFSAALRAEGATVISIPAIDIRPPRSYKPLDSALKKLHGYDWLILTSVNGADALFARVAKRRISTEALQKLRVAAIGPATRDALEQRGLRVHVMPKQYVAESVVEALRSKVKGKKVLLVRARVARDIIPAELRGAGAQVDVVEAYRTVVPAGSRKLLRAMLASPKARPDAITFTSSSTARNFVALLNNDLLGKTRAARKLLDGMVLASIGPVTSATLREIGVRAEVEAREFTTAGLVRALVEHARRHPR
jgi:uroporphyrinogen-III synthase